MDAGAPDDGVGARLIGVASRMDRRSGSAQSRHRASTCLGVEAGRLSHAWATRSRFFVLCHANRRGRDPIPPGFPGRSPTEWRDPVARPRFIRVGASATPGSPSYSKCLVAVVVSKRFGEATTAPRVCSAAPGVM